MKWIYRIIIFIILGVAIASPFMIKNKQGKPMMGLPTLNDLPTLSDLTPDLGSVVSNDVAERTFYKWKDSKGTWHYGDQPPSENTHFTTIVVDNQTNVMQSTPIPEEVPVVEIPPRGNGTDNNHSQAYQPPGSDDDVLTLDRALNIVDDAHAVREMMDQRNSQLEGLSGSREKK